MTWGKALSLDGRTSVWRVTCHRCLQVHSNIWNEVQSKKEGNGKERIHFEDRKKPLESFYPCLCFLPRRECERKVKRCVEIAYKQVSWVYSLRPCHVTGSRENNLQPWKKHGYSVEVFVVVFLKFAVITMTVSVWSENNEKGYFFLCGIKY